MYAILVSVSGGYLPERGMLLTRYAPFRRSPSGNIAIPHAAPRLACVKPAASVHPEPGSNSSLYNMNLYLSSSTLFIHFGINALLASLSFISSLSMISFFFSRSLAPFLLSPLVLCLISRTGLQRYCFFLNLQIFSELFYNFLTTKNPFL